MASIWQVHQMKASPQKNGYECLYAAENGVVVDLSIRTPKQFVAERARFEDQGILLPPLRPVSGAGPGATVDPRYNSLNVPAEGLVVSVQLVGPQPSDPAEQLAQEKRIARSAVGWLHPRSA